MLEKIYLRQGDTLPYLDFVLMKDETVPHDLREAAVVFTMVNRATGVTKINKKLCIITDALLGKIRYELAAVDVDTIGRYKAEIEVTFASGRILSFPSKDDGKYLSIIIYEELG